MKVLMTEGSSTSARQTLYALGGRHTIDILDPSAVCQCRFSRYVRRWHRCPSYSQDPIDYLKFLNERLREEEYDVLFPTHEQVYLLARVQDQLRKLVGIALPSFEAIDRMQGKADFIRLLDELQLPYPETSLVRTAEQLQSHNEYPYFVKGSHGTAGTAVWQVKDNDDMKTIADRLLGEGHLDGKSEILVQSPGKGVLSIIQLVFQNGQLVGSHCAQARALGVGGSPMARVSVAHPNVVEDMRRLGEALNWHGAFFVEYFYDEETGQPEYLEANPRIGETFNATLCGVNLCEQYLRVAVDEAVSPLVAGETGVRTHQGFMILMAEAMQGGSRRRLFGEVSNAFRARENYDSSDDELTRMKDDWLSIIPASAVTMQLLAAPKLAKRIVDNTVRNYSLPERAAQIIREMSDEQLQRCF